MKRENNLDTNVQRLLLYPSKRFSLQDYLQKYKCTRISVVEAFEFMATNKLGTIEQIIKKGKLNTAGNVVRGESETFLEKTCVKDLLNVEEIFTKYGVTLEAYSKTLGNFSFIKQKEQTTSSHLEFTF
jgi:hypothetical protein